MSTFIGGMEPVKDLNQYCSFQYVSNVSQSGLNDVNIEESIVGIC